MTEDNNTLSTSDHMPRYTTKRLHDEIAKAKAYARQETLEEMSGGLTPAGWQWRMKNTASDHWSEWRDGRANFGPDVGFLWQERQVFAVVFRDTNPEAQFIEDAENSCPHCGGSGHKDDVVDQGLWRHIETAPKGYKPIWVGHECGFVEPAYFKGASEVGFWVNSYTGLPVQWKPRMWHPIPAAPPPPKPSL